MANHDKNQKNILRDQLMRSGNISPNPQVNSFTLKAKKTPEQVIAERKAQAKRL